MAILPQFAKGGSLKMPRSPRALKGWRRRSPARSKKPWPWAVWAAVAVELCRMGKRSVGIAVLLMVVCYFRISERCGLACQAILPPTRQGLHTYSLNLFPSEKMLSSKTGTHDEAVPIAAPHARFLDQEWQRLSDSPSDTPVLDVDYRRCSTYSIRSRKRWGY